MEGKVSLTLMPWYNWAYSYTNTDVGTSAYTYQEGKTVGLERYYNLPSTALLYMCK